MDSTIAVAFYCLLVLVYLWYAFDNGIGGESSNWAAIVIPWVPESKSVGNCWFH